MATTRGCVLRRRPANSAARPPASADPTLGQLALAAFDQARIAESAVARWRA